MTASTVPVTKRPPRTASVPRIVRPVVAVLLAAVVTAYVVGVPGVPPIPFGVTEQYRVDLDVYRLGASAWLAGAPLYGPDFPITRLGIALPFVYPPIAAVLFTPFLALPLPAASIVLTVVSGALALGIAAATVRALGHTVDGWWLVASAPLVLLLDPVRLTLMLGQVNILLLALVAVDIRRRGRWRGALVGLAAAVKLTPLVFVLWFLVERDQRAARTAVVAFGAATALGAVLAPDPSVQYWTDRVFRVDPLLAPDYAGNQSIRAVVVRLGLPPVPATLLWLLLAAAVLLLGVLAAQRARRLGEPLLGVLALACAGLLASPLSWSHHWVWCLPAVPVLGSLAGRRGLRWPRWLAGTGLAVFAVGPQWLLPRDEHRELAWTAWQQVVGMAYPLWGLALLLAVLTAGREPWRTWPGVIVATRPTVRSGPSSWCWSRPSLFAAEGAV